MPKIILISTLVSTLMLFVWSAVSQNLPWGVPTVQVVSQAEITEITQPSQTIKLPVGTLTTTKFDEQMTGKISTLMTDKTFSWVISKPLSYYNLPLYFTRELITQLLVSLLLSLFLWNTRCLPVKQRLFLVLLAALATVVATHVQNYNWMGTPAAFSFGVSANLVIGWMLVAAVLSMWLIKTTDEAAPDVS